MAGVTPATTIGGQKATGPSMGRQNIVWGDKLSEAANVVYSNNIVWGTNIVWGENIVWGDEHRLG